MARKADRSELETFVETAFKHADDGTNVSLRAFDEDGPWRSREWPSHKLNGAGFGPLIDKAEAFAGKCANAKERPVFCPPVATFRKPGNATTENLANGLVLCAELDVAPNAARERLEELLGPATLVVESGGIWTDPKTGEEQNKLHLYWRLKEPTRTSEEHILLYEARRIATKLVGGDVTAVNSVHPLRWPGSYHLKAKPRLCLILELNDVEIDLDDTLERLRSAAEAEGIETGLKARTASPASLLGYIEGVQAAFEVIPNEDDKWHDWKSIVMLATVGAAGEEGREPFHVYSAKSEKYNQQETDDEYDAALRSPPNRIGYDKLAYLARQADPNWIAPSDIEFAEEVFSEFCSKSVSRFPLTRFRDVQLDTKRRYIVQGLIPRQGLVVIWGPPKCGKSFWITDLVLHVALGREYRGRKVEAGAVIYIACEGQAGVPQRLEAFKQTRLADKPEANPPFFLLPTRLDLIKEVKALIADIKEQVAETPILIVLDTLNRSLVGSESSDEDMSAYIAACEQVKAAFDCAVVIVHHCGVNGTRPRGHTSLTGAVDAQLAIKRPDKTGPTVATVEWMKDGEEGAEIKSKLENVTVGMDEDDNPITSCVVEPCDDDVTAPTREKPLPKSQQQVLAIFEGLPGPVTKKALRRACISSGKMSASEDEKAHHRAYERGLLGLVQGERFKYEGNLVLLIEEDYDDDEV